jgi:hypothetical protein
MQLQPETFFFFWKAADGASRNKIGDSCIKIRVYTFAVRRIYLRSFQLPFNMMCCNLCPVNIVTSQFSLVILFQNKHISKYWVYIYIYIYIKLSQQLDKKLVWAGTDRLCGLVVRVLGYRSGGPGSIPGTTRKNILGLERGPFSLVSTTEELLDRKVAAPV